MCSFWRIWWESCNCPPTLTYTVFITIGHFLIWSGIRLDKAISPFGWIKRLVFLWDDVRQDRDKVTDRTHPQRLLQRQATTQQPKVYVNVNKIWMSCILYLISLCLLKWTDSDYFVESDSWEHPVPSEASCILEERWSKRKEGADCPWLDLSWGIQFRSSA